MTDNFFVDTNILVYARDGGAGNKQLIASSIVNELWQTRRGRISVQVLNEYYFSVTQKLKPGLPKDAAWRDVTLMQAWRPLPIDWDMLERGRAIQKKYGLSWWDSLIVAAAQLSHCKVLCSEDMSHGVTYENVKVLNPFLTAITGTRK